MAIVDMAYAQSGEPASSNEYNKVVDNVKDLDARTTENTSTGTNLTNRVAALEASTGVGYSVHMFRQEAAWPEGPDGSMIGQPIASGGWQRVLYNATVFSEPSSDITTETVEGGTEFTFHKGGIWRVTMTGSMESIGVETVRILFLVSGTTSERSVYSEHVHSNSGSLDRYSDSLSGLVAVSNGGKLGAWVWHDYGSVWRMFDINGRNNLAFEWIAPLGADSNTDSIPEGA